MEHSAICSAFIKLPFVIKFFVLSILEWLFYTGFTTYTSKRMVFDKSIISVTHEGVFTSIEVEQNLSHPAQAKDFFIIFFVGSDLDSDSLTLIR